MAACTAKPSSTGLQPATGREFADALAWMSRGEDHRKTRSAHLHRARQIDASAKIMATSRPPISSVATPPPRFRTR
jgi:hypothetical protein